MNGIKLPSSASTIQNMVMAYGRKIKMETIEELEALKNYQHRFTITFDEWCSSRNRRYLNFNLHLYKTGSVTIWNLGLVRVLGSFPAEACVSALEKKLSEYKIDLARDIIAATTDGAAVMKKVGRLLSTHHQLCFAHGLQLAVLDVLYKNQEEAEGQVQVAVAEQNRPDSERK